MRKFRLFKREHKISTYFKWYDLWIGLFYNKEKRIVYIQPLPMLGVKIEFGTMELKNMTTSQRLKARNTKTLVSYTIKKVALDVLLPQIEQLGTEVNIVHIMDETKYVQVDFYGTGVQIGKTVELIHKPIKSHGVVN